MTGRRSEIVQGDFQTAAQRLAAIKALVTAHNRGNPDGYEQIPGEAEHVLERIARLLDDWQ
jgi:hypothetical protein